MMQQSWRGERWRKGRGENMAGKPAKGKRWTKHSVHKVIETLEAGRITGSTTAGAELAGVPQSTAQQWVEKERQGKLGEFCEKRAADTDEEKDLLADDQANSQALENLRLAKRAAYIEKAWLVASTAWDRVLALIPECKNLKDVAWAAGVATDKALLASGQATSRTESNNAAREDLLKVAKDAAERALEASHTIPAKQVEASYIVVEGERSDADEA